MSFRKSSRRRNGSKSDVLPNPNARRRCTPAPSSVGLDLMSRLTGRIDIFGLHYLRVYPSISVFGRNTTIRKMSENGQVVVVLLPGMDGTGTLFKEFVLRLPAGI